MNVYTTVCCVVQIEERYTQDALRAEERERGVRKRAEERERGERKRAEETLRHSSYIDQQEKYALSNYQQFSNFLCMHNVATVIGHNFERCSTKNVGSMQSTFSCTHNV
jgi:hypothetical protein